MFISVYVSSCSSSILITRVDCRSVSPSKLGSILKVSPTLNPVPSYPGTTSTKYRSLSLLTVKLAPAATVFIEAGFLWVLSYCVIDALGYSYSIE